jgi:hypothetical protein
MAAVGTMLAEFTPRVIFGSVKKQLSIVVIIEMENDTGRLLATEEQNSEGAI